MAVLDQNLVAIASSFWTFLGHDEDFKFGSAEWWGCVAICAGLVIFAGLMSGLTLGLMSLGLLELEVVKRSGSASEKKQAASILPVVTKQHQLLVTLLLCNAAAMEALPLFLDRLVHPVVAVLLSVTLVLLFGEVIPQAVCSRYGLAVGAKLVWLVKILMCACWIIAYPVGKILDYVLGHTESGIFRRSHLKTLVHLHGTDAEFGGDLTADETMIISGALDLTSKRADEAMTPIESTFSLDVHSKLDWETIGQIIARGHSRIPVYLGSPKNILGLVLAKSLLTVRPEDATPVSDVAIRPIPRVPANTSLYDLLNEFQKGRSHMAAVVKVRGSAGGEGATGVGAETSRHVVQSIYSHTPSGSRQRLLAASPPNQDKAMTKSLSRREESRFAPGEVSVAESTHVIEVEDSSRVSSTTWQIQWQSDGKKPPAGTLSVQELAAQQLQVAAQEEKALESATAGNGGAAAGQATQGPGRPKRTSFEKARGALKGEGSGPFWVGDVSEDAEVIGIITLEDVIEEILQEEIVDETDEFIDVHKRIRVTAQSSAQGPTHGHGQQRRFKRQVSENDAVRGGRAVADKSGALANGGKAMVTDTTGREATDNTLTEPLLKGSS